MTKKPDTRIVYGAGCTWWDSIDKVGVMPGTDRGNGMGGLPCCPNCNGMLFEMDSLEQFMTGARTYEAAGNPGYVAMVTWAQGKCFPVQPALEIAFVAAALEPFANAVEQIAETESDDEWAKFRLLIGDFRRAAAGFGIISAKVVTDGKA